MRETILNFTKRLHERRLVLSYPKLPAEADGLRIGFVADIHVEKSEPIFDRLIAWLRENELDLALVGGDTAQARETPHGPSIAVAHAIFAANRPRFGWFVVRGNNDRRAYFAKLAAPGVRLLENESVRLIDGAPPLVLAGVDDPYRKYDDLDAALAGVPDEAFVIVLAHSPDVRDAVARGAALVLSGHTHGGQIRFPFGGALFTQTRGGKRLAYGLARAGHTLFYTTAGVGWALCRVRLNCPAEVVHITLRRGAGPNEDSGPVKL